MTKNEIIREHYSKLGKKGGPKGGRARTEAMTPEERVALATLAARARWGMKKTTKKGGR